MFRLLKYLIPDEDKDKLDKNEFFQWAVVVLLVLGSLYLIYVGINGIRRQRLPGKRGHVFYGGTAQVLGAIYVILGIALIVIALYVKLYGPLV